MDDDQRLIPLNSDYQKVFDAYLIAAAMKKTGHHTPPVLDPKQRENLLHYVFLLEMSRRSKKINKTLQHFSGVLDKELQSIHASQLGTEQTQTHLQQTWTSSCTMFAKITAKANTTQLMSQASNIYPKDQSSVEKLAKKHACEDQTEQPLAKRISLREEDIDPQNEQEKCNFSVKK